MRVREYLWNGPLGFGGAPAARGVSRIQKAKRIVERLEAFDHEARSYSDSTLEAPLAVTGCLSTLRGLPNDGGSRVEWSGRFTPQGASVEEASRFFQRIFEDGLKALADRFVGKGA